VAARSKTSVYGRLPAEIVGSNPIGGMDVCLECCMLSGAGLCDEMVTRPEESYRLWCVVVYDLETSRMSRPCATGGLLGPPPPKKSYSSRSYIRLSFIITKRWIQLILRWQFPARCIFEAVTPGIQIIDWVTWSGTRIYEGWSIITRTVCFIFMKTRAEILQLHNVST
jgi:hypothetical protein